LDKRSSPKGSNTDGESESG